MFQPIPGGSTYRIAYDDEHIDVHLPPVGYVIDKMPDPKTSKPSEKLIKSEILFDDLPLVDKKWNKPELPKNWDKWIEEERILQGTNPAYTHPDLDYFRAQEWRRRINGVWIAIGNRNKKPTDYFFLTGCHYFYLGWWDTGFEAKFRVPDLDDFYLLEWAEENPFCTGVIQAANRRSGKTAKAFCWYYEAPSRRRNFHGGLQAQKRDEAKEAFLTHLRPAFMALPEFFRPIYDTGSELKNGLYFNSRATKGKNATLNFDRSADPNRRPLNSKLTFKETSAKAYDKAKLHRHIAEEPAKWEEEDIYKNYLRLKPALHEGVYLVGKIYWPTTIEEMKDGGASFVKLFEDSLPSLMNEHGYGKTKSGLIAHFKTALRGLIFDEYGRPIIDDPTANEIVIDERGIRVLEGSRTVIASKRKLVESDLQLLTEEVRKYALTWDEAKSASSQFCHFNHQLLSNRLNKLRAEKPKYIRGNFQWVDKKDGDVDFVRDDYGGRWKVTMLLDEKGSGGDSADGFKIANNVGENWDSDREMRVFFPKNDHKFASGVDPIKNEATDDPRASKAASYVLMKYDALIDAGKPEQKPGLPEHQRFKTNKFICEYLYRPEDPNEFHEDMIMQCRYFGCSIFEEGNVETLRQHMITRGYGMFLVNRGHFTDDALPGVKKEGIFADKAVRTDPVVTHNLINVLKHYFNRYIDLIDFDNLLEDSLEFRLKKHFKKDAVFGAGYTILSSNRDIAPPQPESDSPIELEIFPVYDQSGAVSREVEITEFETWN